MVFTSEFKTSVISQNRVHPTDTGRRKSRSLCSVNESTISPNISRLTRRIMPPGEASS